MSRKRRPKYTQLDYVNDLNSAREEANRRANLDLAQQTTFLPEEPLARCTSDLEAYGATCPPDRGGACVGVCARYVARQGVVLRAQRAAQIARAGQR